MFIPFKQYIKENRKSKAILAKFGMASLWLSLSPLGKPMNPSLFGPVRGEIAEETDL